MLFVSSGSSPYFFSNSEASDCDHSSLPPEHSLVIINIPSNQLISQESTCIVSVFLTIHTTAFMHRA